MEEVLRWFKKIVESEKFMLLRFSYGICSIRKGGERLSKQKVTLRIEEGKVELLKENITRIISQKPSDWQLWKVWLRKIRKKLRRCFRT